jgi:hypothetical protein
MQTFSRRNLNRRSLEDSGVDTDTTKMYLERTIYEGLAQDVPRKWSGSELSSNTKGELRTSCASLTFSKICLL